MDEKLLLIVNPYSGKGRMKIEFVDLADSFACVINSEKELAEIREILEEVLDEMQNFMMKNMHMQLSVVFGSYQNGIYVSVDKNIESATSIWFDIQIRSDKYIYKIK